MVLQTGGVLYSFIQFRLIYKIYICSCFHWPYFFGMFIQVLATLLLVMILSEACYLGTTLTLDFEGLRATWHNNNRHFEHRKHCSQENSRFDTHFKMIVWHHLVREGLVAYFQSVIYIFTSRHSRCHRDLFFPTAKSNPTNTVVDKYYINISIQWPKFKYYKTCMVKNKTCHKMIYLNDIKITTRSIDI